MASAHAGFNSPACGETARTPSSRPVSASAITLTKARVTIHDNARHVVGTRRAAVGLETLLLRSLSVVAHARHLRISRDRPGCGREVQCRSAPGQGDRGARPHAAVAANRPVRIESHSDRFVCKAARLWRDAAPRPEPAAARAIVRAGSWVMSVEGRHRRSTAAENGDVQGGATVSGAAARPLRVLKRAATWSVGGPERNLRNRCRIFERGHRRDHGVWRGTGPRG